MVQRAEQAEAERIRPYVESAERHANDRTELRPERLEVAHLTQVPTNRRPAPTHFVGYQFVMRASRRQRGGGVLGGKDRRPDGVVTAFRARHIHESRGTSDQRPPGKTSFGTDCQPPAVVARAPHASLVAPSNVPRTNGWVLNRCNSSRGLG